MKNLNVITGRRHGWRLAIGLGLAMLVGCATPFDEPDDRVWVDADPSSWRVAGATHDVRTLAGPPPSAIESIDEPADADALVRLALERNPQIRAAERRVEMMRQRIPQATSLDDPMFQIAPLGEMAQTAAGEVGLMTTLSQKLPWPGKLDRRGDVARQDVAMALADLRQTRLQVAAEARRAWWSYYYATRAIEVTRRSRDLLTQFRQIAESEYRAGKRTQPDVLRASVELAGFDNELILLEQRQASARSMINQLIDRPGGAALPAPHPVELSTLEAQLDDLLAQAAAHNPSLARLHERIEQYRQRHRLARLNRWPDINVSLTYNAVEDDGLAAMANGDDQWWLGFGINLPIWAQKYEAAEREAALGMLEAVAELTAQRNRVAFTIEEAYLKVQAQQKLVELFHDTIIPQARQTVESSQAGYRAGSTDFLTLVDNWRKLLNFELMHHRALADMEQAVADLERAVGSVVDRRAPATEQETAHE